MSQPEVSRRGFDLLLLVTLPLVYGAGFLAAAVRYLIPRSKRLPKLALGYTADYEKGIVDLKDFNGRRIFILHDGKELQVLDSTCTHLSCRVEWLPEKKEFMCRCHNGCYSSRGKNLSGPPPKPLRKQAFEVTPEGRVKLPMAR